MLRCAAMCTRDCCRDEALDRACRFVDIMLDSEPTRQALCDGPHTATLLLALASTAETAANDFQNVLWHARMARDPYAGAPEGAAALITCCRAALHVLSGAEEQTFLASAGELPPVVLKRTVKWCLST